MKILSIRNIACLIFSVTSFIAGTEASFAQITTSSISGKVFDSDRGLEGVAVVAINAVTGAQYNVTTDKNGYYSILDIAPGGPYSVKFIYFGYKPLTVRNVYAYVGENAEIDADLEQKESYLRSSEASTTTRLGETFCGGSAAVARELTRMVSYVPQAISQEEKKNLPLWGSALGQMSVSAVPFDVRRSATLDGTSILTVTPSANQNLKLSAYEYYTDENLNDIGKPNTFGGTISGPLAGKDFNAYIASEYGGELRALGRFNWNMPGMSNLDGSFVKTGDFSWANANLISSLSEGRASNSAHFDLQSDGGVRQIFVSDDVTMVKGRQKFIFGGQGYFISTPDSTDNYVNLYFQDEITVTRRFKLTAGIRSGVPFGFSPRLSFYYDLTGSGKLVVRGGSAIYHRQGTPATWKSLLAFDATLPGRFRFTAEGIYGQNWEKLFVISSRNIIENRYIATAKLERPFWDNAHAILSYSKSDGCISDKILAGFTYRQDWLKHCATTLSFLYDGCRVDGEGVDSPWNNSVEARVTQDFYTSINGKVHDIKLMVYGMKSSQAEYIWLGVKYVL